MSVCVDEFHGSIAGNGLQGWVATQESPYRQEVVAKAAKNALQGSRLGVAMQSIRRKL
jgi:hypothetical protein